VVILSAVTPWLSVYGLSAKRDKRFISQSNLPGPVEGQSLDVDINLVNKCWIPRFLLNVQYSIKSQRTETDESVVLVRVGPRANSEGTSSAKISTHGAHKLSGVSVESMGLFGLFRRHRTFTASDSVLVYP
jgi:uncharacterized protein (DUF58 family)